MPAHFLSTGASLAAAEPSHDDNLKLWDTRPASEWVDALPIGNGRLGAMVFGGSAVESDNKANPNPAPPDPGKETLQLNEGTLWSGMPVDGNNLEAKQYLPEIRKAVLEEKDYHKADELCRKMQGLFAEAYQVVGSLHIDCAHSDEVTNYRRELNLATGVVSISYRRRR